MTAAPRPLPDDDAAPHGRQGGHTTAPSGALTQRLVCSHCENVGAQSTHEAQTQSWLAETLARIQGWEFAGAFDTSCRYDRPVYFVPSATLCPAERAHALGIRGEQDLFGGVVPFPFVATKAITHGLFAPDSARPRGWSEAFGQRVKKVVLPGVTVFSVPDARAAAVPLLARGALRVKDPCGIGGTGQEVIADHDQLEAFLGSVDSDALARHGLVFEANLRQVTTLSVGRVRVGAFLASYYGTQRLTTDNRGREVYGGSRLTVVRGDFEALLPLAPSSALRTGIEQALTYHRAAFETFPQMFASRCNYDVAQGLDEAGQWHSGVLEQSWRMGGASGAELVALQAFRDDPGLTVVCASTTEVYGPDPAVPPGAATCFRGTDDAGGPLTKYALLEPYAHS
jgi:hypothetical protein